MDQREKTGQEKKISPGARMFVLCLLYKDSSMEHKWHEGQKGLQQYKWIKGKPQELIQKKNPTGGMDVCVVFVVRTVAWNVK
jgi:hypothetical protein